MKPSEKNFEELIEKLVIINLLCHDEFKNFLHSGINPLQELFLGLFKDYSLEKVLETYKKYYTIYCEPLMEIFTEDLKRIETYETQGRQLLKLYEEELKEIEKEDRNEIIADKYTLEQHIFFGTQLLFLQINNNIRKRELKGENLILTKMALKKLLVNGVETKQTLDTYNELIAEANAQLKIFKLPKSFRKFEKKIKETLLENHREILGENFEETCFEAMKKVQQDNYELNMEQRMIKTGAEPELTLAELKSIRKSKDFFQQSKLIENILDKNKNENIKKLKEQSYEYINGKARKIKDVSLNELEHEIMRLRNILGYENQEDYFHDENQQEPNMDLLKKKVEELKSGKFNSITNFSNFNKDEELAEEEEIIINSENSNELNPNNSPNNSETEKNDAKNSSFFANREKLNKISNSLSKLESEDQKALKRLEIIRDLKLGFKEELEGQMETSDNSELNPALYFDLDIFKGKSLEELKALEVEELHEAETRVSSDGSMQMNEVQVGDKFYKYAQSNALKNSSVIDLSTQQAEANFNSAYSLIEKELNKKDQQRAERIITALESGYYIDDPYYIGLLMSSKKYLHLRERFLKKYYREGGENKPKSDSKDKAGKYFADLILKGKAEKKGFTNKNANDDLFNNIKTPLLDKYINKPGDIIDNMAEDGVFEKYESDVGKVYVKILSDLVNDIDAEEGITEKDLNLEEYEDSALKDIEENESGFNIYELENKIVQENDDLFVTKEEIEKELGWKRVKDASNYNKILDYENSFANNNNDFSVVEKLESAVKDPGYSNKANEGNNEYVPGSKRGYSGKKKAKKMINK